MAQTSFTVALVGNPNTGKSTLFNALSGLRQHVGNYPGVTVEMKKGSYQHAGYEFVLIDLPGTYSLAARSPDEMVAVDLLMGRRPDERPPAVILSIVDASNLDRHLYLTSQLMELGKPVVLAVNMIDVAQKQGITVDYAQMGRELGITVVPIRANAGEGMNELRDALTEAAKRANVPVPHRMPEPLQNAIDKYRGLYGADTPDFLIQRLILDIDGSTEDWFVKKHGSQLKEQLKQTRSELASQQCAVPGVEARTRYSRIKAILANSITKPSTRPVTITDKLDKILTHRVWGTLIFLLIMFVLFQLIFVAAQPLMDLIDAGTKWLSGKVESNMDSGPFRSLLAEGIIAGVGGVIKFLPQILILFAAIAVLEDCGYMARAAFLMDRIMSRCGLSGKSFIPMLSSVACAVPGIMATRVIENRRDRIATIVVAPLMSCSARLPVYGLLIGAFLTKDRPFWLPGLVLFSMYMIGFIVAPIVALMLRKTLLRGGRSLFVMELPSYKRPSLKNIVRRVVDAGWAFIRRAGTMILMSMILVWALLYFPTHDADGKYDNRIQEQKKLEKEVDEKIEEKKTAEQEVPEELTELKDKYGKEAIRLRGDWKRNSYLGRTGRVLEPVFEPLGWDWRIGMAALASFPAREVIVGTLAIIYDVEDDDEKAKEQREEQLQTTIRDEWTKDAKRGQYTIATALSVMVFFALCCQCASTLAVIRRETRSWSWPLFTFVYMTTLAYIAAFAVFQIGRMLV